MPRWSREETVPDSQASEKGGPQGGADTKPQSSLRGKVVPEFSSLKKHRERREPLFPHGAHRSVRSHRRSLVSQVCYGVGEEPVRVGER